MPRVFLVSPSPAVRAGLRALLAGEGLDVAGDAARLEGGDLPSSLLAADVVVVDGLGVMGAAGAESADLGALADDSLALRVVLLGPLQGEEQLPALFGGRPWAYLPRDASAEQLSAAVNAVASGLVAVEARVATSLLARAPAGGGGSPKAEDLTGREREVLQLVALGLPNKLIARRLGITEHTVKFHVAAVLAKLGAASRTEAVHLGARRGVISL